MLACPPYVLINIHFAAGFRQEGGLPRDRPIMPHLDLRPVVTEEFHTVNAAHIAGNQSSTKTNNNKKNKAKKSNKNNNNKSFVNKEIQTHKRFKRTLVY